MHARDRYFARILVALLVMHLATCFVSLGSALYYRRKFKRLVRDTVDKVEACQRASVEACSVALALSSLSESSSSSYVDTNGVPVAPPVVLGYGQTRSIGARYVYRDIRYYDGEVRREFIGRYPLGN